MNSICRIDARRDAVRRFQGRNGLDYVEVSEDQRTLFVYFLGKLPPELQTDSPRLKEFVRIGGGERVADIRILDVDPQVNADPEKDDYLVVRLDRYGDFSTYTLRLVGVENIDSHYDHVEFSFKVDCPSDLDCKPPCDCEPSTLKEPEINYLAKDYSSFRQLLLDRLALIMPEWRERHVPDMGIALVELLAYTGDYLSYYQDSVATEAYLGTARQRISVRRHARLMDYHLHEGCNARAWVFVETSQDVKLSPSDIAFITGINSALPVKQSILSVEELQPVPAGAYEWFEPLVADPAVDLKFHAAHNEIHFYTWGRRECCLPRGTTSATLLDRLDSSVPASEPDSPDQQQRQCGKGEGSTMPAAQRSLQLKPGDVLIFEEVLGPKTGVAADANPARRHAVRLTRVTPAEDAVFRVGNRPTPLLEIEWMAEDALPFPLFLSTLRAAPDCRYIANVSVARGNIVLVDHGRTLDPVDLGTVATAATDVCCKCEGHATDVSELPARFNPTLPKAPVTFREPVPSAALPAAETLSQDVRLALPQVAVTDSAAEAWTPQRDLLSSAPDDRDFVVEVDNDGAAHLRFGNGELGRQPAAGLRLTARYRIGLGAGGNVGAEAISRLVFKTAHLSGVTIQVRNPLPAVGGTEPEPVEEAKLYAPAAFRKPIERAIIAADYAEIAERHRKVQRASAELVWTGSWFEADVAIDPSGAHLASETLLEEVASHLHPCRRVGHDLHVERAICVPLDLALEVCALPGYQAAHVKAALLVLFSNGVLPDHTLGFFHPDNLTFGQGIYLSQIVAAAQASPGVECVRVTRLQRLFEPPNREIENGLLPLRQGEIAQLENDPNHPERGQLHIVVRGGR